MQETEYKAAQQKVALGQMREGGRQLTEAQERLLDKFLAEFDPRHFQRAPYSRHRDGVGEN